MTQQHAAHVCMPVLLAVGVGEEDDCNKDQPLGGVLAATRTAAGTVGRQRTDAATCAADVQVKQGAECDSMAQPVALHCAVCAHISIGY